MNQLSFFFCFVSILLHHAASTVSFPRQSNALAIYPMNRIHYCNDVSGKGNSCTSWADGKVPNQWSTGPYGDSSIMNVAYNYNNGASYYSPGLFYRSDWNLNLTSFTVSFWHKSDKSGMSGIFGFRSKTDQSKVFNVYVRDRHTVEIWANGHKVGRVVALHSSSPSGQYTIWTYISIVYDGTTQQLFMYNSNGLIYSPIYAPHVAASTAFNNHGINVGFVNGGGLLGNQYITGNDAIACLSLYDAALNADEVMELHDACRAVLGAAPCGAPKLPITSVPSTDTTFAKDGQFPWTGALYYGSKQICSGSLLSDYWYLTAASCFAASTEPSDYVISHGVGVDLSLAAQWWNRSISKIVMSPNSTSSGLIGELALVQLTTPIDVSTTYANNICLYKGDESQLNGEENQFMFGWGKNGRASLVSETMGRYVNNKMLSEQQCKQLLGANYNATYHYCFAGSDPYSNAPCTGDEGSALLGVTNDFSDTKGIGPHLIELAVYVGRDAGCSAAKPGIFAKVVPYLPWIRDTIANAIPTDDYYPTTCPQAIWCSC